MGEKIIGIYKITNVCNGDCYIGKSVDILVRWKSHINISKNKKSKAYNYYLYRAFRFYSIENFKKVMAINLSNGVSIKFDSLFEAEKILGIPRSSISQILNTNHPRKQSKGYTFKFL